MTQDSRNEKEKIRSSTYSTIKKFWDARANGHSKRAFENIVFADEFDEAAVYIDDFEKSHLLELIKFKPDMVALDLGCGSGRWTFFLAERCRKVIATDFSKELLDILDKEAKERGINNIENICASAMDFSYPEKFDLILVSGLLLYIFDKDIPPLIKNIHNLLKDDGILIIRDAVATRKRVENLKAHSIYREKKEYLALFNSDDKFKLIYTNLSVPPVVASIFLFKRIIPRKLWNDKRLRRILKKALNVQMYVDKILFKVKPLYELMALVSHGNGFVKRFYIFAKKAKR